MRWMDEARQYSLLGVALDGWLTNACELMHFIQCLYALCRPDGYLFANKLCWIFSSSPPRSFNRIRSYPFFMPLLSRYSCTVDPPVLPASIRAHSSFTRSPFTNSYIHFRCGLHPQSFGLFRFCVNSNCRWFQAQFICIQPCSKLYTMEMARTTRTHTLHNEHCVYIHRIDCVRFGNRNTVCISCDEADRDTSMGRAMRYGRRCRTGGAIARATDKEIRDNLFCSPHGSHLFGRHSQTDTHTCSIRYSKYVIDPLKYTQWQTHKH